MHLFDKEWIFIDTLDLVNQFLRSEYVLLSHQSIVDLVEVINHYGPSSFYPVSMTMPTVFFILQNFSLVLRISFPIPMDLAGV